ncbi:CPBP family intramembrane glutamic endopeptidase [Paenibacillus tarimensis]|uniref:CPBP family intramembrane glutamic endopeptidase n=1 Tax=Paenibacillus tarimensis TaxID=416012 RepID=UPI001F475B00|nr:CPBP family intramembrane glutamic endopeptidase [Paenibacillus tarimensis]MCF2945792.1 CPBP family intramembrane metalloprotease [Paenibacillus tarimensis]
MRKTLNAAEAGWIFLFSYVSGIILSGYLFTDTDRLHTELGYFLMYVVIGQVGLNLLPALVWCKLRGYNLSLNFKWRRVSLKVLMLSLAVYALSQVPILFLHQLTEIVSLLLGRTYEISVYPMAEHLGALFVLVLCIGIIPPICEELLFRGALLTGYGQRGQWFAAAVSSLLFALFHDNPYRLAELFASA